MAGPGEGGRLVWVVGPSGAGKDTLLDAARKLLADNPRFVFPRRLVTRPAEAAAEDHQSISRAEFDRLRGPDGSTLSWEAHGLGYVIPGDVRETVRAGHVAVCNGSRRALPEALARYPHSVLILITANHEVRAARLHRRGRETLAEIEARLAREAPPIPQGAPAVEIDNSGELDSAIAEFVVALKRIAA